MPLGNVGRRASGCLPLTQFQHQENQANGVEKIQLHFAVIGANVAGLSCAIALRGIGHRVTVIDKNHAISDAEASFSPLCYVNGKLTLQQPGRGVRMPPNLTKILFHWGLKDQLHAISVKSEAIHVLLGMTPILFAILFFMLLKRRYWGASGNPALGRRATPGNTRGISFCSCQTRLFSHTDIWLTLT